MKTLVVLLGPTGVGKTELSLSIAEMLSSPIINCDSRQLYADMAIGTAAPTPEEQLCIPHYFVGTLSPKDYYSAARYESDVLTLTEKLFQNHNVLLLSGGSMLYIDAICKGIDNIPTISEQVRTTLKHQLKEKGLESLLRELQQSDPEYYDIVDKQNTRRVVHAIEVCRMSGLPYSKFRTNTPKKRPFQILKVGLNRPREELFERINNRVDEMINHGFLEEVRNLVPYRQTNAMNTVGYKELLHVIDGEWTLGMAIERIKKNTRVYAKKQLTWFQRDETITWFHPNDIEDIKQYIKLHLK